MAAACTRPHDGWFDEYFPVRRLLVWFEGSPKHRGAAELVEERKVRYPVSDGVKRLR